MAVNMRKALWGLAIAVVAAGCSKASNSPSGSSSVSGPLMQQEIAAIPVQNAYEAVQRLRPGFLRARSTASRTTAYPVVYVDGLRRGSPEVLRFIPAAEVAQVRYLSAVDATTRYGMNVEAGVIEVTSISR